MDRSPFLLPHQQVAGLIPSTSTILKGIKYEMGPIQPCEDN